MSAPLLLDLTHTCHTHARTGVQRVARSLHRALGAGALPVTHDPYEQAWRTLRPWEEANLTAEAATAGKRGARWPWTARWGGRLRRALRATPAALPAAAAAARGLVVPEIFSAPVGAALPGLFGGLHGPRVAVFHDAIALKFPELTPRKTVARFPAYLMELLRFDGIAAVSEDSRSSLIEYWRWAGVADAPPVRAIPLGIDTQQFSPGGENSPPAGPPVILCIGSIEGRKNHLALLEACDALWDRGESFSLHLIGLAQPQTAAAALARIRALQARGRPLRYDGPVSDAALQDAYRACHFTVYPSVIEGFGLPVLESIAHGRPCVCSARGALGESAHGGGCVALEDVNSGALADAIARLLAAPGEVARLAREARGRRLRSWDDYARELRNWIEELRAH